MIENINHNIRLSVKIVWILDPIGPSVDAHANLNLHCKHLPKGTFAHYGTVQKN